MSVNEIRRCKWLSAALLDLGKMGVLRRLTEASYGCLAAWTPDFLADFMVRLTSAVAGYSWEGYDGEPTVLDELMAIDADWMPNKFNLDGYAVPAMNAICQLIPIGFPRDYNMVWINADLLEKCKPMVEEERRISASLYT